MGIAEDIALPASWLQPLLLRGGQVLPNRIVPSPMDGVTCGSFVSVMSKWGLVRSWIVPFLRVSTGVPRVARLREKIKLFVVSGFPVIVQIMGTDIELLCKMAEQLQKLGVAGIDLNCGCPSSTVLRNGAGGACLRDPVWVGDAVQALREVCANCAFSVKLRTGYNDFREMEQIFPLVERVKADFVIVHWRSVKEGYQEVKRGVERLAIARELFENTTLLGSGDLFTIKDALHMYRLGRVDGVAPARGILANPWLLSQIESCCGDNGVQHTSEQKKIEFLLANIEFSTMGKSVNNGFILQLVGKMFGRNSSIFTEVIKCRIISNTEIYLRTKLENIKNNNG